MLVSSERVDASVDTYRYWYGALTYEKVDYVNALWERLLESDSPESPHWHRELVRAEVAAHEADPAAVEDWEAVRAEVEQRLRVGKR